MDADLSHPPERLPALLAKVDEGADIAIGSRYVKGGATANWPLVRKLLSRSANIYASLLLGLGSATPPPGSGPTGPTSCRSSRPAPPRPPATASSSSCRTGPTALGAKIVEVPITFNDRVRGVSKMSWHIIGEAMSLVAWWALRDRVLRRSGPIAKRPPRESGVIPAVSATAPATSAPASVPAGGVPDDPAAREPGVEAAAN